MTTPPLFKLVQQEEHDNALCSTLAASSSSSSSSSRNRRWKVPVATLGTAAFLLVGLKGVNVQHPEVQETTGRSFNGLFESYQVLCTDGNSFSFKMELAVRSDQRNEEEVLASSTGATSVVLSQEQVTWRVSTFNYGDLTVSASLQPTTLYSAIFEKSHRELCLHLESEADRVSSCEEVPDYMPISNFQMKPVGKLVLRTASDIVRFEQVSGSVPVTFSLQDLKMERLWDNDEHWRRVLRSLQEMLAALAGNIMPLDVGITPVAPSQAGRGILFQGSVKTYGGLACKVQEKLWRSIHGTDGLSNSLFAAAVVDRFKVANVTASTTGLVLVASASVPGFPTLCSKMHCRDHFPRRLPESARCLGGSCASVCCSSDRLKQRLPFVDEESHPVDDLNVRLPMNAPVFVMPDLAKEALKGRSMLEARHTLLPSHGTPPAQTASTLPPATMAPQDPYTFTGSFELMRVARHEVDRLEEVVKGALSKLLGNLVKPGGLKVNVLAHDQDTAQEKIIKLPKPTPDQQRAIGEFRAKYAALKDSKVYSEGLADAATVSRAEKIAREGKPEDFLFGGESRHLSDSSRKDGRELSLRSPGRSFTVHFELLHCSGGCQARARGAVKEEALKDALGDLHFVALDKFSCPGEDTTCSAYTCNNPYAEKVNPNSQCFGADCEDICCESVTCSAITCEGIDPIAENKDKVCTSKEDCETSCCELKCGDYECQDGTCAIAGEEETVVPPCQAQLKCCAPKDCCCSSIAWCLACMECMDPLDWCDAQEIAGLRVIHHGERQLSALLEDIRAIVPAEPSNSAGLRSKISQADTSVDIPSPGAEVTALPALRGAADTAAVKSRLRWLQSAEYDQLQLGFEGLVKDADAFYQKNTGLTSPRAMAAVQIEHTLAHLRKGHNKHCQHPKGCTAVSISSCSYYFESIFCLHRGVMKRHVPVNAVQVLSDTVHAVSCGDEGSCWVWRICDAKPRTHFVPKTSRGPIKAVSVLFDSLRIVSGGLGSIFGGVGHVWEWRSGKEVATTRCVTGPILAAAEIPEWSAVLLGCGNGYTLKWDWNSGAVEHLPWIGRTSLELMSLFSVLATKCKDEALRGLGHLFEDRKYVTEHAFLEAVLPTHPGLESSFDCLWSINDFFLGTAFGAVRSVAYVPTNVRFVTGQADGKVRYWNAHTGVLLRVMKGHHGPVNAVVAELTTQAAISGGDDGTVRVWCLDKGIQKMFFTQDYGGPVLSLAVYPANRIVVVGSADGYIRMWDLHSGMLLCAINTGGGAVNGVAINPSNPLGQVLAAGAGYVRVFNPR